ncbi:nuclear apoptosis-inducing factor 1-like isoform X1 [Anguilla rostrata]|uniref:nuclear apoptosis-inducing factor 1-like isoform X1 n=1 Tax=Anguilla rostrata TaxID=7938 RepID=UPI0030D35A95
MALLRHKCKKKNFTEREIEVLLGEVERRRSILFNGVSMGVSNKRKRLEWHRVCAAVNASSAVNRSAGEVKKKWFDIKVQAKKRISAHRESVGVGGWCVGAPPLSPLDERLASIIGDIHMSAMLPPLDEFTEMAESTAVKTVQRKTLKRWQEKTPDGKKSQEEPSYRGGVHPPLASLSRRIRKWVCRGLRRCRREVRRRRREARRCSRRKTARLGPAASPVRGVVTQAGTTPPTPPFGRNGTSSDPSTT